MRGGEQPGRRVVGSVEQPHARANIRCRARACMRLPSVHRRRRVVNRPIQGFVAFRHCRLRRQYDTTGMGQQEGRQ